MDYITSFAVGFQQGIRGDPWKEEEKKKKKKKNGKKK